MAKAVEGAKVGSEALLPRALVALTLALAGLLGGHVVIDSALVSPDQGALAALAQGDPAPTLSHFVAGSPAILALLFVLFRRRAVSTPIQAIAVLLTTLVGLGWAAIVFSLYRGPALVGAVEWSAYAATFLAIVAGAGRRGATFLLHAVYAGALISALLALRQYGEMRSLDPNFRVQGPWNNPNALGAYLVLGVLAGVASLHLVPRLGKLAVGLGLALILAALALTASKGAFLALIVGGAVWVVVAIALRARAIKGGVAGLVIAALLAGGLVKLATRPMPNVANGGGAGIARVTDAGEATQSVGFRRLLWRSALELARREPGQGGLNSFGPRSTKPGFVTQTALAHSTPLQLSAEVTPLGGIVFLGFFGACLLFSLRGARSLSDERKAVLAGAFAAVAAGIVHNLVDSDAYYFGLGVTLFGLAGILLVAASDATAPELVPRVFRLGSAVASGVVALFWGYLGWVDLQAATARGLAFGQRPQEAMAMAEGLRSGAPWDARPEALIAALTAGSDPNASLAAAQAAYDLSPSPKTARAVATARLRRGDIAGSIAATKNALQIDPNNFAALALAREAAVSGGDMAQAEEFARRTIAIEGTTYETVRSQPEYIPTAIAEARLFLAGRAQGEAKAELLRLAVRDMARYARTTVPLVVRMDDGSGIEIAGESRARAEKVIGLGVQAAREAEALLPPGDQRRAELAGSGRDFEAAAALLRSASSAR